MNAARTSLFFHLVFIFIISTSILLTIGCGQVAMTAAATPTPTPAASTTISNPHNFVYVTVYESSTVEAFEISSGGNVSAIPGSPFKTAEGPATIARNQDFLFVGSMGVNQLTPDKDLITSYRIDPDTGALTQVAQLNTGIPATMAVDLAGRFLYIGGSGLFSIAASGQLTAVPAPPAGSMPDAQGDFVFNPSGKFVYSWGTPVGHGDPGPFATFAAVDPQTGMMSDGQMLGLKTNGLAVTPDGKFMVVSTGTGLVLDEACTYTINPNTGAPTGSIAGTGPALPFSCVTASGPVDSVALHPSGALVAATGPPGTAMLSLSNGNLRQISTVSFPSTMPLAIVAFSRDGKYLFVAGLPEGFVSNTHEVLVYQVNADTGALTQAPGSPFALSAAPGHMAP